jgi:membrane protease YdiL (CAAX protease family)
MTRSTSNSPRWPLVGALVAIAITSTMDLTGLTMFSALPLFPLMFLFWWLQRLSRSEIGFAWGRPWHYGLAILYPLTVLGAAVLIAQGTGATAVSEIDWQKLGKNLLLMSLVGPAVLVLTEEGFFRGWLWGSLERAGKSPTATLVWSSIAFAAWHWSWAILDSGLDLSVTQVPIYLTNAALMGVVWGLLRWISGSILVASVSHAVWNAIAYSLFGAGPIAGVLGIEDKFILGAEVGLVGLVLNFAFTFALWKWWKQRSKQE